MRIAKADLVPADANLRNKYDSFAELRVACAVFCQQVNNRVHRETGKTPSSMLDIEKSRLHPLPVSPHTLALGESRQVLRDQTVRFSSVRYSTPPGPVGEEAFVRADGDELVIVVDLSHLVRRPEWMHGPAGLTEVARHQLSLPGRPVIDLSHYPGHPQDMDGGPRQPRSKPANEAEKAFRTRPRREVLADRGRRSRHRPDAGEDGVRRRTRRSGRRRRGRHRPRTRGDRRTLRRGP